MPTTLQAIAMRNRWQRMPDRRGMAMTRRLTVGPPSTYETTPTNLIECWHRNYSASSIGFAYGALVVLRVDLYIPKIPNNLVGQLPLVGDRIADTSANTMPYTGLRPVYWHVDTTAEAGALGAWVCSCVGVRIPGNFLVAGQTATLERPTQTATNSGIRQTTAWTPVAGMNGIFIRDTSAAIEEIGKLQIPQRGKAYFQSDNMPAGYVIEAQDTILFGGVRYSIDNIQYPRTLTDFIEIDCERLA